MRARILDEAIGLFARKGYGSTSIHELVSTAGVTTGCLYCHFDSKEDVLIAVLAELKKARESLRAVDAQEPARLVDLALHGVGRNQFHERVLRVGPQPRGAVDRGPGGHPAPARAGPGLRESSGSGARQQIADRFPDPVL